MEDVNYVNIDTWQITVIIALLIVTMVSLLILMAYFYINYIRPLRNITPTNNNKPMKRGRGRPPKTDKEMASEQVEASMIRDKTHTADDRLVKVVKSVPLPHTENLKKLKTVKLMKPQKAEEWMDDLEITKEDE